MEMKKSTEDSLVEHVQLLMPRHMNGAGRLFGGQLLEWIDMIAGVVGRRHAGCNVITAAIDNLQFKEGAHLDDIIVLRGKVTYVGNTSMEVRVDTYLENSQGMRRPINRAYLVMVAMDENNKPVRVPRLEVKTEAEQAEWEGAIKRNEFRKIRRAEGF